MDDNIDEKSVRYVNKYTENPKKSGYGKNEEGEHNHKSSNGCCI